MGRFRNNKNAINVLKCVKYAEEVGGLKASSVLFQAPLTRWTKDREASGIIKIDPIAGGLPEFYPICSLCVVEITSPGQMLCLNTA